MTARVHVRLGAHARARHGGEHDRRQQHDRGVQAQHRGDHRRDHEDQPQQPLRRPPAQPADHRAGEAEHPFLVGQVRQDEHRGQEAHGRGQRDQLAAGLVPRHQPEPDHQQRRRSRRHHLGQTTRPGHRERQHPDQEQHRRPRVHPGILDHHRRARSSPEIAALS